MRRGTGGHRVTHLDATRPPLTSPELSVAFSPAIASLLALNANSTGLILHQSCLEPLALFLPIRHLCPSGRQGYQDCRCHSHSTGEPPGIAGGVSGASLRSCVILGRMLYLSGPPQTNRPLGFFPTFVQGDTHPAACQALGSHRIPGSSVSLCPCTPPPTCFWRRHLYPEELPAPAAEQPPGWVFHPLPCARIFLQLPILSLADNPSHQPSGSSSWGYPGRTSHMVPPFPPSCPKGPHGYLQGCLAPPASSRDPASASLNRGQSGHPMASRLGPSSLSSGIAWPSPCGRRSSIFSELL